MEYKVSKKLYTNEKVSDFKEESTFQNLMRLNRKIKKQGKQIVYGVMLINVIALSVGIGVTYVESIEWYFLLAVVMGMNIWVSLYIGKTLFKSDEERRRALRKYVKELDRVCIKEEDIIHYDKKERKVKFRYLETFFEVEGVIEKKARGNTYLEFKDTRTEGEDYGRLCNVVIYKREENEGCDKEM